MTDESKRCVFSSHKTVISWAVVVCEYFVEKDELVFNLINKGRNYLCGEKLQEHCID